MSQPVLVLLPGLDGTGTLFADLVSEFPTTVTVRIASYPTHQFLSYDELARRMYEIIPSCNPFILIAESFSTPLAVKLAAAHLRNLKGIVLSAGFVFNPVGRWRVLVSILARPILFRLSRHKLALERLLIGNGAPSLLQVRLRGALLALDPDVFAKRIRAVLDCDVREDLRKTQIPIIYIQAEHDRLVGRASLKEIQRLRPDTQFVSVAASHLIFQREPRKSAEIIMSFVHQLIG